MLARIFVLAFIVVCAGCGERTSVGDEPAPAEGDSVRQPSVVATVDMDRFRQDVEQLSSDAFDGRSPSSEGEQKTTDYLISAFKASGLVGGNQGNFLQEVPLVEITAETVSPMTFETSESEAPLSLKDDVRVMWTKRVVEKSSITDSAVVFVGYGIVAPEYDWNDYAGIDVAGKTVVMLVNDPGFATGDPELFNGRSMTYYGRWTYKYEEAARQGAAGVILVHELEAAGYPWIVVSGGWNGPQFDLESSDGNASRAAIESWITMPAAVALFEYAGHDYAMLRAAAAEPGFKPVEFPVTVSASVENRLKRSKSNNVVALLPGEVSDETVAFSAHWDHLGSVDAGGADGIYNGAVDNASGTAALLEMARVLSQEPRRRSYLFLAVTAEESGLLGSAWYARNPTVALEKMAALINIDAMGIIGPTRDVAVIGYGSSTLEDILADIAANQDRVLAPESTPEKGFFYRSDHFNFAKYGVPVLYAKAGVDHREKGREYGLAAAAKHTAERYHQPSDEIHDGWDWRGMQEDLELYLGVARVVARSDAWPQWREGNEFKGVRDASTEQRR
ncbi:MAG: M28 family metallopeptidase [Pseudomonadota bacterium]